ncbi:lysylphosphatidylglycerol synthase transmembrane domain-containing protein [Candidatus Lucifugimonas marina]|uniref:Flippase-like domain-containing protein n=1 Tax=Candidatus Lucifugimonas marina TaxID=3038979 RepID=A0AAJ5ZKV3_9CHLR|nr:flippase-like domain-containing protein [SAR202 cluster bacterium JH702]MDG0870684.1 flippase-like domain-containing protein [SAR202 cluster bacterium JH639]WFG36628.1 flippase-like domain-containing protein [SAR202 cluster bacterium JH545]WFG40561.1 flippase-like domain-containing protein [SAR202 cluster bacterium JH1073]
MSEPSSNQTHNPDHHDDSGMPSAATLRQRVLSLPTLVAILVGAVLLAFALWRIFDFEWDEVWTNIKNVHPGKYLLAIVLYYLSFWFRGLRWRLIAQTAEIGGDKGKNVPGTLALSGIILMGWFANSVAFLRLGDAYRGWALARESKSDLPSSLGTVLAERVQDMAAVLILVLTAAIWLTIEGDSKVPGWVVFAAFALVGALVLGLFVMRVAGEQISRRLPGRFEAAFVNFQKGTLSSFSGKDLPPQLLLGIIGWLLEIARFYFVADAMGMDISFGIVMFAALANAMLTTIPTPGGFGFVEGGLTGLLILFGRSDNEAISLVAVDRTISWLSVVLFGGILFVVWHAVKAKKSTSSSPS